MKPYPNYSITPLPWLPNIPAHWELVRNKNIFGETKDVVGDDIDAYPLLSLTTKGIILRDMASGKGKFPKDFNTYKIVKPGDMAFCLFDIDETPRTVGLSQYGGMLTGAYTIFHVANINPHYAYYYYLSLDNVKAMRPLYSGLRKTINTGTFLSCKLPLPPRPEQNQIVRFLDWKVSSINKLININQKEIAALGELKQNIITKCITTGLNRNVEMKHSGNEWINYIPWHWTTVQLRRIYTVILGKMLSPAPINSQDSYEEYVCAKDVHFDGVDLSSLKKMWFSQTEKKQYEIRKGDLLIVEGGAGAGNAAIVYDLCGKSIYIQNSIHIVRSKSNQVMNKFLCYWISSLVKCGYMKNICSVATIPHYTKDKVLSTIMPLPPIKEQRDIVDYLDMKCEAIDNIIAKKYKQIQLLQELKTRLTSDVVTGKIDVCGIEIPEYEFSDEELDIEDSGKEDVEEQEEI